MTATTTRTLNPLPFQDLEPHRFEDLVRQLAYDWRRWKSLEATGRAGSDEGIDIRAIEIVEADDDGSDDEDDQLPPARPVAERLWVFQCKREKTLAQKRVREIVAESLASLSSPPHGFVLAIACDVSKKTRDAFREEMVKRNVEEFAIWAKGELEDMLFQPKNDRLLFAYFAISLTARRRSISAAVRSIVARKKQLNTLLGDDERHGRGKLVLLRDPTDDRYPRAAEQGEPPSRWIACRALALKTPGHLLVLRHEYLAATSADGRAWDAMLDHDAATLQIEGELRAMHAWGLEEHDDVEPSPYDFWNEYIADEDRAWLKVYRFVPIERVIALDPIGDGYYPVPHVFVEFTPGTGPFSDREFAALERVGNAHARIDLRPEKANRAAIFPKELPSLDGPPLPEFDDTTETQSSFSDSAGAKLGELLAAIEDARKPFAAVAADASRAEIADQKMLPFKTWRDNVALPLFSAFVTRLRAAGHTARVAVRSVRQSPTTTAHESIELRMRVHLGTQYNPSYRPSAHVRVELSEHGGWHLDVAPSADGAANRYSASPRLKVESMPKEQLEAEVLTVLERLRSRGY